MWDATRCLSNWLPGVSWNTKCNNKVYKGDTVGRHTRCPLSLQTEGARPLAPCLDCTLEHHRWPYLVEIVLYWIRGFTHSCVWKNCLRLRLSEENNRRIVFLCVRVVSHFCKWSAAEDPWWIDHFPSSFPPLVAALPLLLSKMDILLKSVKIATCRLQPACSEALTCWLPCTWPV